MNYISIIGTGISMILIAAGIVFVIKNWILWRNINLTGIGIEVAKDKTFLSDNFKLFMALSVLSGFNLVFELENNLAWFSPLPLKDLFEVLYYLNIVTITAIFLILTIMWHQLLSRVTKWDKRWIKAE